MHNQDQITDPMRRKGVPVEGGCGFAHPYRRQSEHRPLHHLCMRCSCQVTTKTLHGKGNGIGTRLKPSLHQPPTASGKKIRSSHHQVLPESWVYLGSGGSTTVQDL